MSYQYEKDKLETIHPNLGKFDFVVGKEKRILAYQHGIGSKQWIDFATFMFEQYPYIYNTCLLMNDQSKENANIIAELQAHNKKLLEALKLAVDDIADWGSYASEFFQQKHDLAGDIAKYSAIIADAEGK